MLLGREKETERHQERDDLGAEGGGMDGREYLYYSEAKQKQNESGQ